MQDNVLTITYSENPEEKVIKTEDFQELLEIANKKIDLIKNMFFDNNELDIWDEYRDGSGQSVRALAMKFHMSRYNIRKKITNTEQKIDLLKRFFSIK